MLSIAEQGELINYNEALDRQCMSAMINIAVLNAHKYKLRKLVKKKNQELLRLQDEVHTFRNATIMHLFESATDQAHIIRLETEIKQLRALVARAHGYSAQNVADTVIKYESDEMDDKKPLCHVAAALPYDILYPLRERYEQRAFDEYNQKYVEKAQCVRELRKTVDGMRQRTGRRPKYVRTVRNVAGKQFFTFNCPYCKKELKIYRQRQGFINTEFTDHILEYHDEPVVLRRSARLKNIK